MGKTKDNRNWRMDDEFYCLCCGKKGLPIVRRGSKKERGHLKKLWCPYCMETVNHMEVRSLDERAEFLEHFERGDYVELAKQSVEISKRDDFIYSFKAR